MKDKNDHLNIDLDFLDKKEPLRATPKSDSKNEEKDSFGAPNQPSPLINTDTHYNWKKILLIAGGVVLFLGWIIFSDNSSSTSTSVSPSTQPSTSTLTPSSNLNEGNTEVRGDYRCSTYDADQSDSLSLSDTLAAINMEQSSLDQRSDVLTSLKDEIDSSSVSEDSPQYEIDDYNQKVGDYNSKLSSYKIDLASLNSRIDVFNSQVDAHNNYLINHCTKAF